MKEKIEEAKKAVINTIEKWKDKDGCGFFRDSLGLYKEYKSEEDIPREIRLECG